MIVLKKKDVLKELAVSLFLMLDFNPDITAISIMQRIRERAASALQAAATYTGTIGQNDVKGFLNSRPMSFTIPCKGDIVKDDIIRFTEDAYDGRRKPPRWLGKRMITAEVISRRIKDGNMTLTLRVISCVGTWIVKPDTEITRPLHTVARSDVMRVPWDDEAEREQVKNQKKADPKTMKQAAAEALTVKRHTPP